MDLVIVYWKYKFRRTILFFKSLTEAKLDHVFKELNCFEQTIGVGIIIHILILLLV